MTEMKSRPPTPEEIAKINAETESIKAQIAHMAVMNPLWQAEAKAKLEQAQAQRDIFVATSLMNKIEAARKQREEEAILAADVYHHTYYFDSEVTFKSMKECMDRLMYWHRTTPGADMEIVFTSPGGMIIFGLALYDFIQQIRRMGHKITTSTLGVAASMAGVLLQAGDVRVMSRESWLLIHEGSGGAVGSAGQIQDTVEWQNKLRDRMKDIFLSRAATAPNAEKRITPAKFEQNWKRKDWWLSSEEALAYGFIDEVR